MASKTVVTCDRCGKEIKGISLEVHYKKRKFNLRADSNWTNSIIKTELCEECKKSFFNWMNKRDDS